MKITITADVHIGVPSRGDDIIWALKRVRQYNTEHGITKWFNLGDLTHDREVINIRDLCQLTEFLADTKKHNQSIYAFPGNHDMFLKNSWEINTLIPLAGYIKHYDNIAKIEFGGRRFWMLPFIHYESDYMKVLEKIEKRYKDGDILLTHVGVKNATLNTCFLLKSWSVVEFSNSPFKRVYAGHFHSHQQVGHNLWYPGSLIPFKFDEGDVDHGFIVYDTDTDTHEFISIWDGKDDNAPPQYLTLDEDIVESLKELDIKGNMVRIALNKDHTNNQLLEIKEHLQKLGARDVRWLHLGSKEEKDAVIIAKKTAASASELFERFVLIDKDGIEGLDHTLLLAMNKEVIAEGDKRYDYTSAD